METDFPDIAAALTLKARLTVPAAGMTALDDDRQETARAIQQTLRDGLRECRPVVWTADVLLGLAGQSVNDSLALTLIDEAVRDGMTGEAELWVANHGGLITTSEEPLVIEGLLLVRHPKEGAGRSATLPDEPGVLVAALVASIPQLVFWWPVGHALSGVIRTAQCGGLALPLLAIGHWAGWGLAGRASGALQTTEVVVDATDELALVVCPAVTRETAH